MLDPKPSPLIPAILGRAPAVDRRHPAVPATEVPAGGLRGTGGCLLTVASFRTWRGSQTLLARGPTIITSIAGRYLKACDLGRDFDPARADCGYRAPLAPHLARPRPLIPPSTASRTPRSPDRSGIPERTPTARPSASGQPLCAAGRMGRGSRSGPGHGRSRAPCSATRRPH